MDAWWPKLVEAEFEPGLGDSLYGALTAALAIDESPAASHGPSGAHSGSAFQYGWWGFVDKDLRQVLGRPVQGPLARTYCGNGDLSSLPGHPARHAEAGGVRTGRRGLPR